MWPQLAMLAAQLVSKGEQDAEARRRESAKLMQERAQRLGANTAGVEAANFNRQLSQQNFASPQQLMGMYGAIKGKPDPTAFSSTNVPKVSGAAQGNLLTSPDQLSSGFNGASPASYDSAPPVPADQSSGWVGGSIQPGAASDALDSATGDPYSMTSDIGSLEDV